jgi:ABC-type lipoprotein release transport system permease subunit
MVFFLAFRNIIKNKKNSILIALPVVVITFLFFIGNSVIEKAEISLRRAFIESLTGDVVIEKNNDVTMNLFGANTPVIDSYFTIPVLPAYDIIMEIISKETGIDGITSQVSGTAYMDLLDIREQVLLCGVDADTYFSLFPGIVLEEGRFLRSGEYGAMITIERAQRIEQRTGQQPAIGIPLLFTSGGDIGFKIREVPLVGIFRYQNPAQFMDEIVIVDPQTVRVLNSIQVAGAADKEGISSNLLNMDIDSLFNDAFFSDYETDEIEFSVDLLMDFLSESNTDPSNAETGGDWNFIILRLKKGIPVNSFISSLNKKIDSYGLTAVNWRIASGNSSIMLLLVQILINSGIFLVSITGIVAMLNIILISVFRRVREIGTLRAIGASDAYIRSLVYCENLIIALIAGFTGVLGGLLFLRWVNSLDIHIANELIVSIMNGSTLQLDFLPNIAIISFGIAALFGLAASVYPVETAVRIEPEAAVRRG